MLSLKECTCGKTTFQILVDTKIRVACTACGTLFTDVEDLHDAPTSNLQFKLEHA